VRTGDTPSTLASRWGLPQSFIARSGHVLKVGEVITIPLAARVKIQRGDSLSSLSKKYGVPVETLAKFNRIPPPYRVRAGRTIMVPAPSH
jgi:spore germination protein